MKLTAKLLGFLNSVFDKDPHSFIALKIGYKGSDLEWRIEDQILTTAVTGGVGYGLYADLSQHTIRSLVDYIASQSGYSVTFIDQSRENLSARVLLDGSGRQSQANGDRLLGYTSLLWAWLEAVAVELKAARAQIDQMVLQMNVNDGSGLWLDEIGSYYSVLRLQDEPDAVYGPRIIAETVRPHGNNIALELAIQAYTGQDAKVVDVIAYGDPFPLYDGAVMHNASQDYDAEGFPYYGLFDVQYGYDLINGEGIDAFKASVESLINRVRDAGTHMRALALTNGVLEDAFTPPTDAMTAGVAMPMTDALTAPTETVPPFSGALAVLSDSLTAPTDNTDSLVLSARYVHDGFRLYDGKIEHYGGLVVTQGISGPPNTSEVPITNQFDILVSGGGGSLLTNSGLPIEIQT